jgi:ABC-type transport system involved in multi-copper enzyme maturation permease subunit
MKESQERSVLSLLSPLRLTGPLFDKELRVSSRRRRNYALRFVYVILLTFFVAIVWLGVVESQYSPVYQKSRMALAGKRIITTIVWFQFIATQVLAVIMLSTSISDEVYHKTLGLLMTTPMGSIQIVMGKLFSKLLQLILLLAISLPLLAVVRVFGGVPADYLISSLCMTLTAVIFAGSASLFFSINNRRSYVVIIKAAVALLVLFAVIPAITGVFFGGRYIGSSTPPNIAVWQVVAFLHVNPFAAMSANTAMMMSPVMPMAMPTFYWPAHCAVMLGGSAILIALSVTVVRKVALRQATGQLDLLPRRHVSKKQKKKPAPASAKAVENPGIVRRVKGSPVLWKEIRAPMIRGVDGRNSMIGLVITIIALFITYGICKKENCLHEGFVHVVYVLMFVIIGAVFTMVLSATTITSEKESSAWPIMLATSMDDWQILLGKAAGVFRRCLPIWLLLAGHVLLFMSFRYIHPIAIVHLFIFVVGLVSFLTGVGLYFSARFKRTTSAVVANLAVAIALWAVLPGMLGLILGFTRNDDIKAASEIYISGNPIVQCVVVTDAVSGEHEARMKLSKLNYDWPTQRGWSGAGEMTLALLTYMIVYVAAGVFFAWRAKCRFRRNIF